MSEDSSFFDRCTYYCRGTSSECDLNDAVREHQVDAQDPELAKHRQRFLDYPYKCEITSPRDLHNPEETRISIIYAPNRVAAGGWNSAFQNLVDEKLLTDLNLTAVPVEPEEVAPDFAILLKCPLKSLHIVRFKGCYDIPSIPPVVSRAFETLTELETLAIIGVSTSYFRIDLLSSDHFPKLRYLEVQLDKELDFGKLTNLTFLRLRVDRATKRVDLRSLRELRALEVYAFWTVVELELAEDRSKLQWLHLENDVIVKGDVSVVTHLFLGGKCERYDIVRRCPNLKQLSLTRMDFDTPIAIPGSVRCLLISLSKLRGIELPLDKTFDMISLSDVIFLSTVPQTLKATHLRLSGDNGQRLADLIHSLRATVLGSPKSLCVECLFGPAVLGSLLEMDGIRRDIQFFATNIPLENPLPTIPNLHRLCLQRFADVHRIQGIGVLNRIEKLFITGIDRIMVGDWQTLRLRDISKSLLVPAGLEVPDNLGLPVQKITVVATHNSGLYTKWLWADYVQRSSAKFDGLFHSTF